MFRSTHQPNRHRHRGQRGGVLLILLGVLSTLGVVAYVGYGVLGIGKPAVVNNPTPQVGMCGDKPCQNNFPPNPDHQVPDANLNNTFIYFVPRLTFPADPGPPNFVEKPYTSDFTPVEIAEPGLTIAECQAQIPTAEANYRASLAAGVTVTFSKVECLDPQ